MAFLVGVLANQTINILGTLKAGELLAFFYLLFINKKTAISKVPASIFFAAIAWSVAQLLSDVINKTELTDAVKGIGAPLVFLVSLTGLIAFLTRSSRRLPSFLLGLPIGALADLLLNPRGHYLAGANPWKWGFESIVSSLALIIYSFIIEPKLRSPRKVNIGDLLYLFVVIILTVVSLGNESRSSLISPVIFIGYLFLRTGKLNRYINLARYISPKTFVKPFALVIIAFLIGNIALTAVFQNSFVLSLMPQSSQAKTIEQSSNQWGLLFGGRTEIFASAQAFLDKPLLGHGSWAKDPIGFYTTLRSDRLSESGQDVNYDRLDYILSSSDKLLIPAHSYLFGGLVWAGIMGGIFWIIVLSYVVRTLLNNYQILSYYFFAQGYGLIWSIFFSPFGYSSRFNTAIFMAVLISEVWFSNSLSAPWLKQQA